MKLAQATIVLLATAQCCLGSKLNTSAIAKSNVDYDHLQRSIVRIQSVGASYDWFRPFMTSDGGTSLGSGFILQTEPYILIATNQHVINDALSVKIQLLLHSERKWDVNVVSACPKFDLALLTLKDDAGFKKTLKQANIEAKALPLSKDVAQMGEDVVALGFPLGQTSLKISKGNIAGNEVVNRNLCIQSTAPISPGNSGGPLMNEDGTIIVGVNFAGATSGENINYVIPAWRVRSLMNKHLKDQPKIPKDGAWRRLGFKTPDHGLLTVQPNEALYESSGGCKKGIYIGKVHKDGFMAAAKPAVKAGSMLVSVNGLEMDVFGTTPIPNLMMGRAHLDDLFFLKEDLEEKVPFTTCFEGKEVKHHVNTSWTKKNDQGIIYVDEPVIEGRHKLFEVFGELAVMEMTVNHVGEVMKRTGSPQISRWLLPDHVMHPRLMVVYVRPGGYVTEVLPEGAAVEKLNGKKVRTLNEWREALVPVEGKVWTLETDMGVVVAMPFKETLTEQIQLSASKPFLLTKGAQDAALEAGLIREVKDDDDNDDDDDEDDSSNDTEAEKSDKPKDKNGKKSSKKDKSTGKEEDDESAKKDEDKDPAGPWSDDDFVKDGEDLGSQSFLGRMFGWLTQKAKKPSRGGASLLQSSEKASNKKNSNAVGEVAAGPLAVVEVSGGLVAKPSRLVHEDLAKLLAESL